MASLQRKGDAWYGQFYHLKNRHTVTIGNVSEGEAIEWRLRTEGILQKLKQGWIEVPDGMSITDFIECKGKPKTKAKEQKTTTLAQLRDQYVETYSNGGMEANSLYTCTMHLKTIEKTLGGRFQLSELSMAALQKHIDKRQAKTAPVTIRKEINSFRAAYNWGKRMDLCDGQFPSAGLVYAKRDEKLPFMTWEQIERRIKAGGNEEELWEALYLDSKQIADFLAHARSKKLPEWVYPMLVMAAHTGARRSELIRAKVEDIDLEGMVATIREKKRQRGARSSRRVPLTNLLAIAMKPLLNSGRIYLFGDGDKPLSVDRAHRTFKRVTSKSKWDVVRGFHVARHSFISACAIKNVDQRMLQSWCGHMSAEMSARYTHLLPNVQKDVLSTVFG
jgi:integrase